MGRTDKSSSPTALPTTTTGGGGGGGDNGKATMIKNTKKNNKTNNKNNKNKATIVKNNGETGPSPYLLLKDGNTNGNDGDEDERPRKRLRRSTSISRNSMNNNEELDNINVDDDKNDNNNRDVPPKKRRKKSYSLSLVETETETKSKSKTKTKTKNVPFLRNKNETKKRRIEQRLMKKMIPVSDVDSRSSKKDRQRQNKLQQLHRNEFFDYDKNNRQPWQQQDEGEEEGGGRGRGRGDQKNVKQKKSNPKREKDTKRMSNVSSRNINSNEVKTENRNNEKRKSITKMKMKINSNNNVDAEDDNIVVVDFDDHNGGQISEFNKPTKLAVAATPSTTTTTTNKKTTRLKTMSKNSNFNDTDNIKYKSNYHCEPSANNDLHNGDNSNENRLDGCHSSSICSSDEDDYDYDEDEDDDDNNDCYPCWLQQRCQKRTKRKMSKPNGKYYDNEQQKSQQQEETTSVLSQLLMLLQEEDRDDDQVDHSRKTRNSKKNISTRCTRSSSNNGTDKNDSSKNNAFVSSDVKLENILTWIDYELECFGSYVRLNNKECKTRNNVIEQLNTIAQSVFSSNNPHYQSNRNSNQYNNNVATNQKSRNKNNTNRNGYGVATDISVDATTRSTTNTTNPVAFQIFGSFATLDVCTYLSDIDLALWGAVAATTPANQHHHPPPVRQHLFFTSSAAPSSDAVEIKTKTPTTTSTSEVTVSVQCQQRQLVKSKTARMQYTDVEAEDEQTRFDLSPCEATQELETVMLKQKVTVSTKPAQFTSNSSENKVICEDEFDANCRSTNSSSHPTNQSDCSITKDIVHEFIVDRCGETEEEKVSMKREENDDYCQQRQHESGASSKKHRNVVFGQESQQWSNEIEQASGKSRQHQHDVKLLQPSGAITASVATSAVPLLSQTKPLEAHSISSDIGPPKWTKNSVDVGGDSCVLEMCANTTATTASANVAMDGALRPGEHCGDDSVLPANGQIIGTYNDMPIDNSNNSDGDGDVYNDKDEQAKEVATNQKREKNIDVCESDSDTSDDSDDTADKMSTYDVHSNEIPDCSKIAAVVAGGRINKDDGETKAVIGYSFKSNFLATKNKGDGSNSATLKRKLSSISAAVPNVPTSGSDSDEGIDSADTNSIRYVSSNLEVSAMSPFDAGGNLNSMFHLAPPTSSDKKIKELVVDALGKLCRRVRQARFLTQSVQLIRHAKVPIIKINTVHGFETDIAIGGHNGTDTSSYASSQVSTYQSFATVVLFLKMLLAQHGLDVPFEGGLGSYKLYVLVASHIQKHLTLGGKDRPSEILLSFLYRYGGGPTLNYNKSSTGRKRRRITQHRPDPAFVTVLDQDVSIRCNNHTSGDGGFAFVDLSNVFRLDSVVNAFKHSYVNLATKILQELYKEGRQSELICKENKTRSTISQHGTIRFESSIFPSFLSGIIESSRLCNERRKCLRRLNMQTVLPSYHPTNQAHYMQNPRSVGNLSSQAKQKQRTKCIANPWQRNTTSRDRTSFPRFTLSTDSNNNNTYNRKPFHDQKMQVRCDRSENELLAGYRVTLDDLYPETT